jgi:hypothetical protein
MDNPGDHPELASAVAGFKGLMVSQLAGQGDVDLSGIPYWDGGFSASLATWLACYLECDPVLLCGMDCYQGEQKYFYPNDFCHPAQNYPLENHLEAWRPALRYCPSSWRIKAVSGPLMEIFGKWNG